MNKPKKKIIHIKNYYGGQDLIFLEKNFDVIVEQINGIDLINFSSTQLFDFISIYDIIIIGGGPQHLTNEEIHKYPEIFKQIEIIKIVSQIYKTSKIVIGICLGCQIISLAFGYEIVSMKEVCIGFEYLDINTINTDFIINSNNIYLSNLDYNLLAKSLSYHYDQINMEKNIDNSELIIIGKSKLNVPYIIKHCNLNIFGFQFHPEFTFDSIKYRIQQSNSLNLTNIHFDKNLDKYIVYYNSNILMHFFEIFINN